MKVIFVFIFSFILLTLSQQESLNYKKKKELNINSPKELEKSIASFYLATQTGIKSGISRPTKKALREMGLIHLMTPSGIHLSSLLLFLFIFIRGKYRILVYIACAILIMPLLGFYSLKRIILFHLLKTFSTNNQYCFLLTFALDLVWGGYQASPLSFTYSFLCWGVIVFSRNKLFLILNIFIAQTYISYFNQEAINGLSLLINPILTSIFSMFFPLMSLNFWVFEFSWLTVFIGNFLKSFLYIIENTAIFFSFMLFIPSSLLLLFPLINIKYKKQFFFFLIFLSSTNLNVFKGSKSSNLKIQLSYAHKREVLKKEDTKLEFFDRTCKRGFRGSYWEIKCKKKALRMGGPFI